MPSSLSVFARRAVSALALGLLCAPFPATGAEDAASSVVEKSVVKVFATVRDADPYRPWTKGPPTEMTGSGVVIDGKRILTNAHVVGYASQVQVQANEAGVKIPATVEAIAPGIDLAILKLESEEFFDSHPPLQRESKLPGIKDAVMAYGFPTGGNSLSITKGIVSRIEFTTYEFPVGGLRIQIDAAVNPGNSGGPAVVGDKMVGVIFSQLGGAENIGYIIPCEEIELFLDDVRDGRYDGKPLFMEEAQTLENPALRPFLKLDKETEGLIVNIPSSAPGNPLKKWDLITKIGDTPVDLQGMVKIGDGSLRVHSRYLVQKTVKNGKVPVTVVRSGKELKLDVPVPRSPNLLIPDLEGAYPSYFVYGPIVFSTATLQFMRGYMRASYGGSFAARLSFFGNPLLTRAGDSPAFEGERLVVVPAPFFPHKLAKGYSNPVAQVVKSINGKPIKNLEHLVEVLRDAKEDSVVIEFVGHGAETLVFPRSEVLTATDEILTDNGIRSQGTPDTMAIWNRKPGK